jgi:hypothetical protein
MAVMTTDVHGAYPHTTRAVFAERVTPWTNRYVNTHLE